ncbi:MAG: tRNA lysidine(34) synthetase TilS [Anaerolineaceae bacterium]|nr:MAG: tRNA lysidine(34) synthetase TilS [Anaerolineaceae bacterium]
MEIYQQVADFIRREQLLQPGQRIIVGVSGGPDSLCLLDCLHRLGYQVLVGHLDHQLRPESPEEARFVEQVAQSYGLEAVVERTDVKVLQDSSSSLEEKARLARYRFLVRSANERGIHHIATGHTSDDQVETILMHFLRGAGPSGLRGMLPLTRLDDWIGIPEAEDMVLIRPLLEITRDQTQAHCAVIGLEPIEDESNLDMSFTRNRLRHELLPLLETYNPGIRRVMSRTGKVMAGEAALLAHLVANHWESIILPRGEGVLAFNVPLFLEQPIALQRALLREAIAKLRPSLRDIGFEIIEQAIHFISIPQRGKCLSVVGELEMLHFADEVLLRDPEASIEFLHYPQLISDKEEEIIVPGQIQLAHGWTLEMESDQVDATKRAEWMAETSGRVAALDERFIGAPFSLRSSKPGDRIRLLGMEGRTKVSDLLVNHHIPQPARSRWPLVVSGDQVLWVVGLRMSHDARIRDETQKVIVFRLQEPSDNDI